MQHCCKHTAAPARCAAARSQRERESLCLGGVVVVCVRPPNELSISSQARPSPCLVLCAPAALPLRCTHAACMVAWNACKAHAQRRQKTSISRHGALFIAVVGASSQEEREREREREREYTTQQARGSPPVRQRARRPIAGRDGGQKVFFCFCSSMESPPGPPLTRRRKPPMMESIWKKSYRKKSRSALSAL